MNPQPTNPQEAKISFSMDDFAQALEARDYEFSKGQVVRGKVESYDNTGVYVDIGGKSAAFLPLREISLRSEENIPEILPLNEERDFLIIKEQNEEGQVTLSIRQLEIKLLWEEFAQLQTEGHTVQVRVTGFNKGGVTVDLRGMRGFIPRSHLLEKENLPSLVGESLTVNLLEVNPGNNKLVFSQRLAVQSTSFSQLELGQLVEGKVSSIKPFGVFVDLDGITGLIHIKQVSQNYTESLAALFHVGQEVKAMIIDLDEGKKRVSLSTKLLENHPGEILENVAEVMESAEARSQRARKKILNMEG